jgi:hypothetical protein
VRINLTNSGGGEILKKIVGLSLLAVIVLSFGMLSVAFAWKPRLTWDTNPSIYVHGLAVDVGDGEEWYFVGPGSEAGKTDIPGHVWRQVSAHRLKGLHYNVGPPSLPGQPWWATGEDYGVLLYVVEAIIAPWSDSIANKMASKGYIHYHELVNSEGEMHPTLVVWLKHIAVRNFNLDGGPAPDLGHTVRRGVDYLFVPIYFNEYAP